MLAAPQDALLLVEQNRGLTSFLATWRQYAINCALLNANQIIFTGIAILPCLISCTVWFYFTVKFLTME